MKKVDIYKSPFTAMLWSFALPGFGQLYNRDYLLGLLLITWEVVLNLYSNLNIALMYSFHGDFAKAHEIINYEWGLFYPSVFAFSMWQAYNKAKVIRHSREHDTELKKVYFTGLFFGLTAGMNIGLTTHIHLHINMLKFLNAPVFSGVFLGMIGAGLGHLIEMYFAKQRNSSKNTV
ncbi:hypothetical protein [Virgibacillus ihumii]|uniref:hypothetical protein n=1 Tax=Virgibacillus ihumii TaxID=2686091 RepID=UPI00157C299D|nr:hypothetical protein [Virgibacillus ihumii]